MIEEVNEKDICKCVNVIRVSFATVADEFGFTAENAPKFTAFATTEERLKWHLFGEHRRMYAFWDNGKIVGYYSLLLQSNNECELIIYVYFRHTDTEKSVKSCYFMPLILPKKQIA